MSLIDQQRRLQGSYGRAIARRRNGVAGNARLTSSTAAVLFLLFAAEGLSLFGIGRFLTLHIVVGMMIVPPLLVKLGSTSYRFTKYYLGDPAYKEKGPPPVILRMLGPFLIVVTFVLMVSGIALLYVPGHLRSTVFFVHKASFVLWFGALAIHVLGHLLETAELAPRDWSRRTREDVAGASARQWLIVTSIVAGLILGIFFAPDAGRFLLSGGVR